MLNKQKQLVVSDRNSLLFIELNEIIKFTIRADKTIIHLTSGKNIRVSKTLKEYEDLLKDETLFRIHHSILINITQVKKFIKGDQEGYVVMSDGKKVKVSRRKKIEFLARLTITIL